MIELIQDFVDAIRQGRLQVYNEFSLQHELGIFLRGKLEQRSVQFERTVSFFFNGGHFVKKEIDISVFNRDKSILDCAIELKYPRNGQYPEQMFSFCKDMLFAEQLRRAGFATSFVVIFADDPLFYAGPGDGIYEYFRQSRLLGGLVQKPTGKRDETIALAGSYLIQWCQIIGKLRYTIVEAVG